MNMNVDGFVSFFDAVNAIHILLICMSYMCLCLIALGWWS